MGPIKSLYTLVYYDPAPSFAHLFIMCHRISVAFAVALVCASPALAAELTVSAAASLSNALREIAAAWESQNPGDEVLLNFAASGTLLQQIDKGAPVDVLATADEETMDRAQQKKLIDAAERRTFARNELVVVVPTASKHAHKGLGDLRSEAIRRIAVGDPRSVPAGRYAQKALASDGSWDTLQAKWIRAQSVRQVLDYVARGEVDAGFVYATDAAVAGDRVRIAFSVPLEEPVLYPVAPTATAGNPDGARSFITFLTSEQGREILARFGFAKP